MAGMGTYNDLLASSSLFCRLLDDTHQNEQKDPAREEEPEHPVDLQDEDEEERPADLHRPQLTINSTSSQKDDERLEYQLSTVTVAERDTFFEVGETTALGVTERGFKFGQERTHI